jgi:hypothetical protein
MMLPEVAENMTRMPPVAAVLPMTLYSAVPFVAAMTTILRAETVVAEWGSGASPPGCLATSGCSAIRSEASGTRRLGASSPSSSGRCPIALMAQVPGQGPELAPQRELLVVLVASPCRFCAERLNTGEPGRRRETWTQKGVGPPCSCWRRPGLARKPRHRTYRTFSHCASSMPWKAAGQC